MREMNAQILTFSIESECTEDRRKESDYGAEWREEGEPPFEDAGSRGAGHPRLPCKLSERFAPESVHFSCTGTI